MKLLYRLLIIVGLALTLLASGCNKDKLGDAVQDLSGLIEDSAKTTWSNPQVVAAAATDGWDGVLEVGLPIFWGNLKLKALSLANGSKAERALYDLIMDESPLVARMIYRETELGPAGIWVDLNTAAQSVGYDGASLGLVVVLTTEQWDWLAANLPDIALLHYNAVRAEGKLPDRLTMTADGIDTGRDW